MTLLELLVLLRKHLRLVIALPAVCTVLAVIVCWGFMSNVYTAETSVYASTRAGSQSQMEAGQQLQSELYAAQLMANDLAEIAKNKQVQADTATALGLENLDDFGIDVSSSTNNRVIKISVTSGDPSASALVANELTSVISDTALRVMNLEATNVVNPAEVPDLPSGPNRKMYVLVALLAGLFAAVAIVVLLDMLNTTVRNEEDIREITGLPVIGRYPAQKEGR